jgi:hypothetical protein
MGRFERVALQVSALPMDRQDVIAGVIERAFDDDLNPKSLLSDTQLEIVRQRMAEPFDHDVATDEEVGAAFAELLSNTRHARELET